MVAPLSTWDRLLRAMRQADPNNEDGLWFMGVSGTVNILGGGSGGTSMTDNNPFTPGGTAITPMGAYVGGRQVASGNAGAPAMSASAILQVHVVAGGAGGGNAQMQVTGTDGNWLNVGYASGSDFRNVVPMTGSINPHGVFAPAGSVNVFGSVNALNLGGSVGALGIGGSMGVTQIGAPWSVTGSQGVTQLGAPWTVTGSQGVTQLGAPWSVVGSMGVTPLASFTVNLGNIPTVNLGAGTVNVGNAHGIFGSVSALGSVNIGGVAVVDTRGSMVPTQWIISAGGSGQFAISGSAPANQRIYWTGYRFIATGTVDVQFQSPSGVAITGSLRILPGAGMVDNGGDIWPLLTGSQQSPIFMLLTGTQNVGGWANGYIGP